MGPPGNPGHLFVANTSVTHVYCDALLCPGLASSAAGKGALLLYHRHAERLVHRQGCVQRTGGTRDPPQRHGKARPRAKPIEEKKVDADAKRRQRAAAVAAFCEAVRAEDVPTLRERRRDRSVPSSAVRPFGGDELLITGPIYRQWYAAMKAAAHTAQGREVVFLCERYADGGGMEVTPRRDDEARSPLPRISPLDLTCPELESLHTPDAEWRAIEAANGAASQVCTFARWEEHAPQRADLPPFLRPALPDTRPAARLPRPIFACTEAPGDSPEARVAVLLPVLTEFVIYAKQLFAAAGASVFRGRRGKLLLAVPVVGTNTKNVSSLHSETGRVVKACVEHLSQMARDHDVDIVLCCADDPTYAIAQDVRRKLIEAGGASAVCESFRELVPKGLQRRARELAQFAAAKAGDPAPELALFLGAGVSIGAGLPGWFDLLLDIERDVTGRPAVLGDTCGWNPLLMAERLEALCDRPPQAPPKLLIAAVAAAGAALCSLWRLRVTGAASLRVRAAAALAAALAVWYWRKRRRPSFPVRGNESLRARIAAKLRRGQHSLLMALLAVLPVKTVVTQNYDTLIEQACEVVNVGDPLGQRPYQRARSLSVLPYQRVPGASRVVLKMHGCASFPSDIVVTKRDYDAFEAGKLKALGGLVHSSLMTSHFLFLGFSMTDPNYLRILEEVRGALRPHIRPAGRNTPGAVAGAAEALQHSMATSLTVDSWGPMEEGPWRQDALRVCVLPLHQDAWDDGTGKLRKAKHLAALPTTFSGAMIGCAARRQEVFVDLVGMHCSAAHMSSRFILDPRFASILSAEEQAFRDAMLELVDDPPGRNTVAYRELLATLRGMGLPPTVARSPLSSPGPAAPSSF